MNHFKILKTSEFIPFLSASLSTSLDQWLISFDIELVDKQSVLKLTPAVELSRDYVECELKIGNEIFRLIIESPKSRDTDFSYSATGQSLPILLAEPYANKISRKWNDVYASEIVQEMCDLKDIVLNWVILDWKIEYFIAEQRYPIDVINDIVNDIGAILVSMPDGSLEVTYSPKFDPAKIEDQAAQYFIATDKNIFNRGAEFVNKNNYTSVLITTETDSVKQPTITLEQESLGADLALVKVFTTPFFGNDEVNLFHASRANVNFNYQGIAYANNEDTIVIKDGVGQLSKAFDEIVSINWHQDVSGTLAISKSGAVSCSGDEISLVTISYKTKYLKYLFEKKADIDKTLVVVDDLPAVSDDAALSLEVEIGSGGNPASPVVVRTLSTKEALLEKGKSILFNDAYDLIKHQIEVAYEGDLMQIGSVIEVEFKRDNKVFNALLTGVAVSKSENDIVQNLTLEVAKRA